jgi:hypothetical protein
LVPGSLDPRLKSPLVDGPFQPSFQGIFVLPAFTSSFSSSLEIYAVQLCI